MVTIQGDRHSFKCNHETLNNN